MASELDMAWLAGLLDGEGCIAFMRRTDYTKHRLEVRYDVKLAMACKETVGIAYEIMVDLVGDDAVKEPYEEKRKIRRRRPLWRTEVSSKDGVYRLLSALEPFLRTKRTEALLCLQYLDRARHHVRYKATDYDRSLAECATALRNGCGEARLKAKELLEQVIPSQAEGRATSTSEGLETRGLSSTGDNGPHECPAPHLRLLAQRVKI